MYLPLRHEIRQNLKIRLNRFIGRMSTYHTSVEAEITLAMTSLQFPVGRRISSTDSLSQCS